MGRLFLIIATAGFMAAAGSKSPVSPKPVSFTIKDETNRVRITAETFSEGAICRRLSMYRVNAAVLIRGNILKLKTSEQPSPLHSHCQTRYLLDVKLRNLPPGEWQVELESAYKFTSRLKVLIQPDMKLTPQEKLRYSVELAAYKMYHAFVAGDYENYRKYIYPPLLKFINEADLKRESKSLNRGPDNQLARYVFFQRKRIREHKGQLQALVERHTRWIVEGKPMHLRFHLLALSDDRGKTWTFVEVNALTDERIEHLGLNIEPSLQKEFYCFYPTCKGLTE